MLNSLLFISILAAPNGPLSETVHAHLEQHRALYRKLHQHPELAFHEVETSRRLAYELETLGFVVTRGIGGHGVVGLLHNGAGPTVMLRTDMDALPLVEKTGLPFASTVVVGEGNARTGVMHACGHDMHMAVWLGVATALVRHKDLWRGTLMMVGQPAEETGPGAEAMLKDGLFKRFGTPDAALAYHVSAELPAGSIGYGPGPFFAGVESVDITVVGVGGHGAMPHRTIDPIVLASRMVLAFQTIVSRELDPTEPAVVTIGSIHGGTTHNIVPDEVTMQLTVRYYSDGVHAQILESIRRISAGIARSAGLPESKTPKVVGHGEVAAPLVNDETLTQRVAASFADTLGQDKVVRTPPVTTGEDFAYYGRTPERVPISLFWLGSVEPSAYGRQQKKKTPLPSLHHPGFHPDFDLTYETGVTAMAAAVIELCPLK
ncbi:MAG: hypothetical protein A2289_18295 [Deltaproteobacteria bacterium RIFOXYA12_FULL_58_15]|nr:MAG: hypothetical protein A2289_18295 [Deltaproteobacteria bacterium RIFOXYA12_FULL_58_15]OGR09678.1 MAG: hypothetical protein A2341_15025 [Deltaproteobacteria bacterium RIFOXYB12_FULL_58_9]